MERTFLYPHSRQFPFDQACHDIVRALEAANWSIPGIHVEFHDYGSYICPVRKVSQITGPDFFLWFSRIQSKLLADPKYNDSAGVHDIHIPGHNLSVYDDESGPTYHRYDGDDWEDVKDSFMGVIISPRELLAESVYTRFSGECRCKEDSEDWFDKLPHAHPRQRTPLLVAHSGSENEEILRTEDVFERFTRYLEDVVLPRLKSS